MGEQTIFTVHVVRAWNGKWHLYAGDRGIAPAEPVGDYNRVAKPEREKAVTMCGENIYVRQHRHVDRETVTDAKLGRLSCVKCNNIRVTLDG